MLRDVLLTGDEFRAMAEGMADTDGPATGTIGVSSWIRAHADGLGRSYANEIERHFKRAPQDVEPSTARGPSPSSR